MSQSLVRELNIIIIRTPDLTAARAFYGGVLGLSIENETPNFLVVQSADGHSTSLGIGIGEASVAGAELWWRVEDTDALHATLVAKGVRITAEPKDEPFGRAIAFADPAGNILHAFQPPR